MFVILKAYNIMGWEKFNNFKSNVSLLFTQQTSNESLLWLSNMLSTGNRAVGKSLGDMDKQTLVANQVLLSALCYYGKNSSRPNLLHGPEKTSWNPKDEYQLMARGWDGVGVDISCQK